METRKEVLMSTANGKVKLFAGKDFGSEIFECDHQAVAMRWLDLMKDHYYYGGSVELIESSL